MELLEKGRHAAWRVGVEVQAFSALRKAGMIGGESPVKVMNSLRSMQRYGALGAAVSVSANRYGERAAIVDDFGEITFTELERQTNRLTDAWRKAGLGEGSTIGILCRNHRGPLIATFAAARLGAKAVWLNTSFARPQARDVAKREGIQTILVDEDLLPILEETEISGATTVTATADPADDQLAALIASGSPDQPPPPSRPGKLILLTSGTTGTPKGAPRSDPKGLSIPGAVVERMPFKAREAVVIAPPLFHGTGLLIAVLTFGLGSTMILRRKFAPDQVIEDLAKYQATGLCVVPVMLQRMLVHDELIKQRDLSHLRAIFCAGSQLPGELSARTMDALGEVVYNLYGSTEVSLATMATPADMRSAPGTVGKPMLGSRIRILDDKGAELPQGQTGRIFVGATIPFEGYTGGGTKEIIDGLMSSGDVGHFDAEGRLFIDGRDDEMIVSGGENVFPREIEELLVKHDQIVDAAAIGVPDDEFGQRLRAFVVRADGAELSEDDVREYVRNNLARYKIPRDVVFLDDLPRNPTGKILKRELAELK